MSVEVLKNHPYIQELISIENQYPDRYDFHENVKDLLLRMGNDKDFLRLVMILSLCNYMPALLELSSLMAIS